METILGTNKQNFYKNFVYILAATFIPALFFVGLTPQYGVPEPATGFLVLIISSLILPIGALAMSLIFSPLILVLVLIIIRDIKKDLKTNTRLLFLTVALLILEVILTAGGRSIPTFTGTEVVYPATGFWLWVGVVVYVCLVYQIHGMDNEMQRNRQFKIVSVAYIGLMALVACLGYQDLMILFSSISSIQI